MKLYIKIKIWLFTIALCCGIIVLVKNMNEKELIRYYNKFSEDKRLNSRHGKVEFCVTMNYLKKFIEDFKGLKILDIGAGTGKYSFALADFGAEVTAVELVKYNLGVLKSKGDQVKAIQGNATNLKRFADNTFDVVLLFGPMYHLLSYTEKSQALNEAKRVTKEGGLIFISYLMNDYAVIVHGFRDGNIKESIKENLIDENFQIVNKENDLYSYIRIEEIGKLCNDCGLERVKTVAQDGPTDYIRPVINKMDEEEFDVYIKYVMSIAERQDMIGVSSHVLDILKKPILNK